jgi:histone H3/H4
VTEDGDPKLQWHVDALNALHEASEVYMTELFEDASSCTVHAKRKTLYREDVQLVKKLRGLDRL